jgi:hypothetical protein
VADPASAASAGPRRGVDGLPADIAHEREHAPIPLVYHRVLARVVEEVDGDLGAALARAWEGRAFVASWERPFLLVGALRLDALGEGPAHPLWRALAAPEPAPESVTAERLREAFAPDRTRFWRAVATRFIQTNETSRAVAWLWPAALAGAGGGARTLALVDLGASAGLNLVADALPAIWTVPGGAPLPVAREVRAACRVGLDARPLDLADEENADWLRACIWAGDVARLQRLEEGIAAMRRARSAGDASAAPVLQAASAREFPARVARIRREVGPDPLVLAYQSVFRNYLEAAEREEYEAGMRRWLAAEPPGRSLWVELEARAEGATLAWPAALVTHLPAPGGGVRDLLLARCGYHPRVIAVEEDGARELTRSWRT